MSERLTLKEARERVARGVKLLNEKKPGWKKKIDRERLDMSSCEDCILGQLFGSYRDGLYILKYAHFLDNGFSLDSFILPDLKQDWQKLKRAWLEVLNI